MKKFISLILLFCCTVANAVDTKKTLIGKWIADSGGEGALKQVTTLEFRENGDFYRQTTIGGQDFKPILGGKWQLTTSETGVKALFADANKLIVTYKEVEPSKMTEKTDAWLVTFRKDQTTGGKEMLCLGPLDGALLGTQYYYRAP